MASRAPELLTYAVPGWGVGALAHRQGRPVLHDLPERRRRPAPLHLDAVACDPAASDPAERLVARLGRYFRGEREAFGAGELGLEATCDEWGLTGFMRRAALALCAVPYGQVVSYGELAERAGAPRAARAAGTFCAGIQLGLFLPAHRVVRADGSLGEYGPSGTRMKARLLRLEGVRGVRAA